jgi:transcriptional regulator with GAF, ATPase, and Fis domain
VPVEPLDVVIRRHIESALMETHGRIEGPHGAARLLRINPHTLRARMRKLKIDWRGFRRVAEEGTDSYPTAD